MKLSSQLFVVLSTMVVGTVWIAAEPCNPEGNDNANGGYGKYDKPACDFCAHSGKGTGDCCDAIYRHSLGRDDDDDDYGESLYDCSDLNDNCRVGKIWCYPGLVCADSTCTLPTDNPNAHAASSLVTSSSSTGSTITEGGGPSFVLVVVGLLGAAMTMLYHSRHRGFLRRHQYNAVDAATATRMDV